MSINKEIKVEGTRDQVIADDVNKARARGEHHEENIPSIDKGAAQSKGTEEGKEELGDYEGTKHQPEIDGEQQDSQETDEVYLDPRAQAGLPPAGKNVGDLNAHDLGRHDKD